MRALFLYLLMSKWCYVCFILTCGLFYSSILLSQRYNFINYIVEDGLSNPTILSITQLENNEIWLGTNSGGINTLNGAEIGIIDKTDGLINNIVYDFYKDSAGTILIGTNNGITSYSNGHMDSVVFADTTTHKRIFHIFGDSKGIIWIATGRGLAQLRDNKIYTYTTGNNQLDKASCIHISEDLIGNLWVSTMGNHVFKIAHNNISSISFENDTKYTFSTFHPDSNSTWLLSFKGLFELKNGSVSRIDLTSSEGINSTYYQAILKDSKGNIWIGTKVGLLLLRDNKTQVFTTENGLAMNHVMKLFEDNEGNIWIGTRDGGVSKFNSSMFQLKTVDFGLPSNKVQATFIDSKGNIWVGTDKGCHIYNQDTAYTLPLFDKSSENNITCFNEDIDGNIYVATGAGISFYGKNEVKRFRLKGGASTIFKGTSIYLDSNEVLLGGVQGLATIEDDIIKLINEEFHFPTTMVHTIAKDNAGTYWFGTDEGLMSFDGNTLSYPKYGNGLLRNKIRTIIIDENSNLWIAIGEKIVVYSNGQFKKITDQSHFNSQTIYSMRFDDDGNLWIGRQNGVDRLEIDDFSIKSIRSYEEGKGFMARECNNSALSIFENSEILIGTNQGLLTLDKNKDEINSFETNTEITAVKLFSQETDWSEYSDTINHKGFPVNLSLSFRENYFTFHFIGVTHRNPNAVRYKYKLEGFDKDWINAGRNRLVTYSNLPFGKYKFKVKSSNDEGVWNVNSTNFTFTISPPFWKTWWFYALCAIAVLFVVVSYYQIRASNIKIKRRNEKINQQNAIIEEKNQEIVDSITYAKRIQDAILPSSMIGKELPNCFVYYRPKDIVSGDFYWMKNIQNKILIAAVDCTGHGVPGGFVSMVGYSGLNRAVSEYQLTEPGEILEKLSELVTEAFDDGSNTGIKDGMDAAICSLDPSNLILHFSGANNPLYIIRHNKKPLQTPNGDAIEAKILEELYEIKGTRRPVGSSDYKEPFLNKEIQLEKDDIIYLFTDGYPDQFGGAKGKKLMYKPFKRMLLSYSKLPMEEQRENLELAFNKWKQEHYQIDDICIIGIRV